MIRSTTCALFIILLATSTACVGEGIEKRQLALSEGPSGGLLAFINDQSNTDFDRLDIDCAIRSDSARNIIRERDGHDKVAGTSDDSLFTSVGDLDDVKMVGPWTMNRLTNCAWLFGYMKGVGPSLSGTGTAAIEGVMNGNEWANAATLPVEVPLDANTTVPGTVHVMTDAQNLYMALEIDANVMSSMFRITVLFDNNNDGFVDPNEDHISAVWSPYSHSVSFADTHVLSRHSRASDGPIYSSVYDSAYGGTSNGGAGVGQTGGVTVLELWHPLASGDSKDLSIGAGSNVDISVSVGVLADKWYSQREWATLAVSTTTPEPVPTMVPQSVIDQLDAIAQGYKDTNASFPMEFAEQMPLEAGGAIIGYRVVFSQWIDPEGGIKLYVEFELDTDFNIVSEQAYI